MSDDGEDADSRRMGVAGRIARAFINSKLTPLLVVTSVLLGVASILMLPREEEPQIRVPMIDVLVSMPGFSAKEVEERATRPMEKLLWEIPGVEYIYSTSRPGESLAIVRFKVGEDVERSLVKLNQKLQSNFDRIPPGVSQPLIKPRSIDDVPILALTFHSSRHDHLTLRRLVAEVDDAVKQVPLVAETTIIGGVRRQVRVLLDPARLASRRLSMTEVARILPQANRQSVAGGLTRNNRETLVETGGFLAGARETGEVVVGVFEGRPVYLREVAEILDGAEEPSQYVFFGHGAATRTDAEEQPAVTLSVAKRPGANAIDVAHQVLRKVDTLKGRLIPNDVEITVTRDYGETA
ncbi:MAG TPA: efflux RND transporter permease subunit, partial [Methylomirabilota bacterium]|nr:efflux RND transporter permease subunit [Methylomirabilota bacterium]